MPRKLNDPGWDHLFEEAGAKYNIDPLLLKSIMFTETGDETDPVKRILDTSPKGAVGPMQLLPSSFPGVNPYDPAEAIPAAASYLAKARDEYGYKDPIQMLMFYHGGPDTKQWGPKTKNYPNVAAEYYKLLTTPPPPMQQQQMPLTAENMTTPKLSQAEINFNNQPPGIAEGRMSLSSKQPTRFDPNEWITDNADKLKLDGLTLDKDGMMVPYDKQGKLVYDAPGYDYEWARKYAEK